MLTLAALAFALMLPIDDTSEDGLVRMQSAFSVAETADRLDAALRDKGMTVFTRIDHAEGADRAGLSLRPTVVVLFGNPKVGTLLMQCDQDVAIDLPQKALIYEDAAGDVWLAYNDPAYLAGRHGLGDCEDVLQNISNALQHFAEAATTP